MTFVLRDRQRKEIQKQTEYARGDWALGQEVIARLEARERANGLEPRLGAGTMFGETPNTAREHAYGPRTLRRRQHFGNFLLRTALYR